MSPTRLVFLIPILFLTAFYQDEKNVLEGYNVGAVDYLTKPVNPKILRSKVGVFVDASAEFVRQAVAECGLDTLQFHGQETPEFCAGHALRTIKAFRIQDADSLNPLSLFKTSAWLLDSFVPGKLGGTGAKFNWDLAVAAKKLGQPIILAGGLTPENIEQAVKHVRPYAVDVSSGVELKPGKKDAQKLRMFIAAAQGV